MHCSMISVFFGKPNSKYPWDQFAASTSIENSATQSECHAGKIGNVYMLPVNTAIISAWPSTF